VTAARAPIRDLDEALNRLVAEVRPRKVILFGSHASGRARPGSDLDLLVVADLDGDPDDRIRAVSRALRPRAVPLDILVYTQAEFRRFSADPDSFLRHILDTGKIVYEAPDC